MEKTAYYTENSIPYLLLGDKDPEEKQKDFWGVQPTELDSFSGASGNQKIVFVPQSFSNCAVEIFETLTPPTTLAQLNVRVWISEFTQCINITSKQTYNETDKVSYYSFMLENNYKSNELDSEELIYNLKELM